MAKSWPLAQPQVLLNSRSWMFVSSLNPYHHEIATDEIQRKNCEAHTSAHVSALTGLVPYKMAEELQSVSAPCWNQTSVARLTVTRVNN